jgi:hypothetical protein
MNWEQWLATHQYDIDMGDDTIDLMKQAYVAGLRTAHDLLDNAEPEDFHWCRHEIEKLIEESE